MSSYGLVVPNRPLDTSFQPVDVNKQLIIIPEAYSINHLVVFLTAPIPPEAAACIFFSLPDPNAPPTWHYLGFLSNSKQSAIFKITNLSQSHKLMLANGNVVSLDNQAKNTSNLGPSGLAFNYLQDPVNSVAQVGISLEPIQSVTEMIPAVETTTSNVNMFVDFINKTVNNMYNYCTSFSQPLGELVTSNSNFPSKEYVPLTSIKTWFETYTNKLRNDPNFWRTLN